MLVVALLVFGGCSLLGTKSPGDRAVLQVEKQSDDSRETVTLKITYRNTTSETIYLPRGHESCIDMEVQKNVGQEWRTAVAYGCAQVVEPPEPLKPGERLSHQDEVDLSAYVEMYDWMTDTAGTYRYQARIGYKQGDTVEYVTHTSNTFEVD